MSTRKFTKNKLSLALATALVGGMTVSSPSSAVDLDNNDRLGDAAIFPYFSAKGNWQTFFRVINTSDDAVVVKVRFREAANSREILDFEVALSPFDMWAGWTDRNALGNNVPGIKTNDTSCIFPLPNSNGIPGESFKIIDPLTNLLGAEFESRAFTGDYDDQAGLDALDRMSEGHFEVIGVARYDCSSRQGDDQSEEAFCRQVSHNEQTGKPNSCSNARQMIYGAGPNAGALERDDDNADGDDFRNVMAANAYMVNVPSGQGAGYDPDILIDCARQSLELELISTDTSPDLDTCRAGIYGWGPNENPWSVGPVAVNQRLWNGDEPPPVEVEHYRADLMPVVAGVPTPDGVFNAAVGVDINGDDQCTGSELFNENDVPEAVYNAANENNLALYQANGCTYRIVTSGGIPSDDIDWLTQTYTVEQYLPWRLKQKGKFVNNPPFGDGFRWDLDGTNIFPVTGGVDDVSRELMRSSVINEWAASYNPDSIITDYFTQWVLTFPTKHYYVDIFNDPIFPGDDISPTLALDERTGGEAFAPFTEAFGAGGSCEPFSIAMYNRDERFAEYASPSPVYPTELCWETNVINFNERYEDRGLASNFAVTIPEGALPSEIDGSPSERGWAELTFTGLGTNVGLGHEWRNYFGLPVTGFLFSVYNTQAGAANNHTAINAHKYTRDYGRCNREPIGQTVDAGAASIMSKGVDCPSIPEQLP